jgi:hypothetical protein
MARLSEIINYSNINESNTEFRRADYWLVEIDPPRGIYFPGNKLIQFRTTEFDSGITDDPNIMEKSIRGFTVKQGAKAEKTSGTMTLTIQDRVDQTMSYFIDQWKLGIGQRDELSGLPKELYVSPMIKAIYFNINEAKIREIWYYNCMLSAAKLPEDGDADVELEGTISMDIDFEHFKRIFVNKPVGT